MTYNTYDVAIINEALQALGTRTTVTTSEMTALSSNEAIQADLIYANYRNRLLRMAPWDCGIKYSNLVYITSVPGTPENTSAATNNWTPGQPAPPWAYEYWYPDDCLRACWIIPSQQTGFADGIPITTAVTGGAPAFWQGQPIKFKVSTDQFKPAATFTITAGGTGHAVGDVLILGGQPSVAGDVPAGIVQIKVSTVDGTGAILTAALQNFATVQQSSLLFALPTYALSQVTTTGIGTGASITVATMGSTIFDYRTILTNQEFATLAYVKQVTDPNVMDDLFKQAWINVLAGGLVVALTGDKALANEKIALANKSIEEARKVDGNEGLTMNDVTPDFIRIRGIAWTEYYTGPWSNYDWGSYWPVY